MALACVVALGGCANGAEPTEPSGTLTVFAAASLREAFDEIAREFEEENPPLDVVVNYGGSSALAEQILQGARVDVFAAASEQSMGAVVDAELTSDPQVFATNTLQIAVPTGNPGSVRGLSDFARTELAVALCAVEVPCGEAAARVFDEAGVVPSVDTLEQDVKAVVTKVSLGEVDAGLVYRTDVIAAEDSVDGIDFAGAGTVVNRYSIATIAGNLNSIGAQRFIEWILVGRGQGFLEEAGFGAP